MKCYPIPNGTIFGRRKFKFSVMRLILLFSLFLGFGSGVSAQNSQVQDSLDAKISLLKQLVAAQNFERAQFEAEDFRWFLRREKIIVPHAAVPLLSGIYFENGDKKSVESFFAETELAARRHRDIDQKSILLKTLILAYEKWEMPEKALAAQRQLSVAQDSLASRKVTLETIRWRRQIDSLTALRKLEQAKRDEYIEIEKPKAKMLGAIGIGLAFLILLGFILMYRNGRRKLAEKEEEAEFLRSERFLGKMEAKTETAQNYVPPVAEKMENTTTNLVVAEKSVPKEFVPHRPGEVWATPLKTALVIEPNRKITLYLKTLLADEFEVHTTYTPYEGLQMAAELLPDLIVCDAILNGKTGIEVIREIKFDQRTSHIPVLMLTNKVGNEAKLDAMGAGADLYFPRPILDTELDAQIHLLMGVRKAKQVEFSRTLHLYFTDHRVPAGEPFLEKTMAYISSHLHEPDFTPDELSKKMQLTKFHFQKKLFVLTGREAIQLIREMRMEKAKIMLERQLAPLNKIAELVGYTNTGTFSMNFKEYFGDNTVLMQGYKVSGLIEEKN